MSQMDLLVTNVAELLTAAVQEVLQLMGQAMLEYQRESGRTRMENQSLQQKLKELQDRTAGASDKVLKVSFPRDEPHLGEDHVQEDLLHRGDSVMSEEILSDNPVHIKLVLDDITVDNQHHFLQGTCDYSLTNQRPLSRVKSSPPRRIPNPSSGSRETPATSNTDTLGSNKIKLESKPELPECSVTEERDNATTQAPVVPMQDAPLANEHNHQLVSTFSDSIAHYNQPCKLLNFTSKHILRSRVENTVHTGDVHSAPCMSESIREFMHSCHVCGKTFATPSSLGAHFVCHSNERPFVCKYCKFRFSRSADLKKHERIHTGERPFNCSLCGRRFNRTENLKRHLRKVHYGAAL